jgi:hypothetical protein
MSSEQPGSATTEIAVELARGFAPAPALASFATAHRLRVDVMLAPPAAHGEGG